MRRNPPAEFQWRGWVGGLPAARRRGLWGTLGAL